MRILLVDNYDSFTFNLYHLLEAMVDRVTVVRNDELDFNTVKSFDKIILSPGPGLPSESGQLMPLIQEFYTKKSILGICLGHQVLALANGISTFKMHNGHRRINHPIKNLLTGKGEITSQNHGFAVDREQTEAHPDVEITHVHLNDNTVAGIRIKNKPVFSVQYHPEASPGPHDARYLFDQFIENIKNQ